MSVPTAISEEMKIGGGQALMVDADYIGSVTSPLVEHLEKSLHLPTADRQFIPVLTEEERNKCRDAIRLFPEVRDILLDIINIISERDNFSYGMHEKSEFIEKAVRIVSEYIDVYSDVLSAILLEKLNTTVVSLKISYFAYKGLGLILRSQTQREPVDQLKEYSRGLAFLFDYVRQMSIIIPNDLLNPISRMNLESIASQTLKHDFPSAQDLIEQGISKSKRNKILRYIKESRSDALSIQQTLNVLVNKFPISTKDDISKRINTDQQQIKDSLDALNALRKSWEDEYDEQEMYESSIFCQKIFGL